MIGQSQARIPLLTSWLSLTRCRKDWPLVDYWGAFTLNTMDSSIPRLYHQVFWFSNFGSSVLCIFKKMYCIWLCMQKDVFHLLILKLLFCIDHIVSFESYHLNVIKEVMAVKILISQWQHAGIPIWQVISENACFFHKFDFPRADIRDRHCHPLSVSCLNEWTVDCSSADSVLIASSM